MHQEGKYHSFIHQTFKCLICARHWARCGVFSDASPQFLPSGSSLLEGRGRPLTRQLEDIMETQCWNSVQGSMGAPRRET